MDFLAFLVYCQIGTGCVTIPEKMDLDQCHTLVEKIYYSDSSKNAQCIPINGGEFISTRTIVEQALHKDK